MSTNNSNEENNVFVDRISGLPTIFGIMMEWIRTSGYCNMIIDIGKACAMACCVGVYMGQKVNVRRIFSIRDEILLQQFGEAYKISTYPETVRNMEQGLEGSYLYEIATSRYADTSSKEKKDECTDLRNDFSNKLAIIEKSKLECLKIARFARDESRIRSLQTQDEMELLWGGVQLMRLNLK